MTAMRVRIDFSEFLVRRGLLASEQADEIRKAVEMGSAPIGRLLVMMKLMTLRDVVKILEVRRQEPNLRFGEVAVREGYVTQEQLAEALKRQWSSPSSQAELIRDRGLVEKGEWEKMVIEYVNLLEDSLGASQG